jgi:hypothetical protein
MIKSDEWAQVTCIYHNCTVGRAAALAVYLRIPAENRPLFGAAAMVPGRAHFSAITDHLTDPNLFIRRHLILIDFTTHVDDLLWVTGIAATITYIDSHPQSTPALNALAAIARMIADSSINIIHDPSFSAAHLAWRWAFPDDVMPPLIEDIIWGRQKDAPTDLSALVAALQIDAEFDRF